MHLIVYFTISLDPLHAQSVGDVQTLMTRWQTTVIHCVYVLLIDENARYINILVGLYENDGWSNGIPVRAMLMHSTQLFLYE